jgi:hypothetical protein
MGICRGGICNYEILAYEILALAESYAERVGDFGGGTKGWGM